MQVSEDRRNHLSFLTAVLPKKNGPFLAAVYFYVFHPILRSLGRYLSLAVTLIFL